MDHTETVTRLLLSHRRSLHAYVSAIVRDPELAEDVFQDVSVVILRRAEEFGPVRDFWALARGIARRQALAALRTRKPALKQLAPDVLDALDEGFDAVPGDDGTLAEALRACVEALPPAWRDIVALRYWENLAVDAVAARTRRSANTVSVTLNRIRSRLADCVRRKHDAAGLA